MRVYKEFNTITEAKAYRHNNGTGGWIFGREDNTAILFPVGMTPTDVMLHPLTKDTNGELFC